MTTLIRYYLFICVHNYHKPRHIKDTLLCEGNKREVYRSVQHPFLGFPSLRHLTFCLHESHVSDSLSDLDIIFPRTKYHLGIFGLVLGILALHWVTDKSFPEMLHFNRFSRSLFHISFPPFLFLPPPLSLFFLSPHKTQLWIFIPQILLANLSHISHMS